MDSQASRAVSPPDRPARPPRPLGQLWQVPVFVAGLLAVLGVWQGRLWWNSSAARQTAKDFAAVRQALDPASPDTARALALGEDLLERVDQFPERAAEVHFLLGSAYLLRAGEVSPEQAGYAWKKAREHLEQAEAGVVPDADRPRLKYRLARVWFATGGDPQAVINTLTQLPEAAMDDRAEGYGMLTQAFLRLPQPDLAAALQANARQLALPTDNESLLAPARLLRGKLLLQLHQAEEARKVLARIRPPGEVFARARWLRAESCQQDHLWQEAAPLWEEILKDAREASPGSSRALYYLGVCYHQLHRCRDAARTWERVLPEPGETGQAAALGLAELRLKGPNPAAALECYERALRDVKDPAHYHNGLVDLAEARRLVEAGCRLYARTGDFERAQRLAQLLDKLAPGAKWELLGSLANDWGRDCLERARQAGGASAARLTEEALGHFREAAAAYAQVAAGLAGKPEQPKWLWLSGLCYFQGQDWAQAEVLIKRYLEAETNPGLLAQGWYTLADVYRNLPNAPAARAAYRKCIELNGPLAFRARYQLCQDDLEQARAENSSEKLDDVEKALEHNLELMRFTPDEEAYEKTLVTLAGLAVQRGNYRLAAVRLQELLDRYPANANQLTTRLQLADCYRRLAAQEDQNLRAGFYWSEDAQLHYRGQRRQWLEKAVAHYQKLVDDLTARAGANPLSPPEEVVLRQGLVAAGESHFELGRYTEAIGCYERVVARYPRQAETLKALRDITRCYWVQKNFAKAKETIQRVRVTLQEVPDQVFRDPEMPSRREWEEWLEWAWKQN